MALEQEIVDWSVARPSWQRMVLQKIASGHVPSPYELDELAEDLISGKDIEGTFGLGDFPRTYPGDLPVRLISVENPEHLNAISSRAALTFGKQGLTIIYGYNGSGKSGYARLLKQVSRSRSQEEILTDVFRDSALEKTTATLRLKDGDKDIVVNWPQDAGSELQRVLFFDGACANTYVATESDFPYQPFALFVVEGLIGVCREIRGRIDTKLAENEAKATRQLPIVEEDIANTKIGLYLKGLSGRSSPSVLDTLLSALENAPKTIAELKEEEARLRAGDVDRERQKLSRNAQKLESIRKHLVNLENVLGDDAVTQIRDKQSELNSLETAASIHRNSNVNEPLKGVGLQPWRILWDAARQYSMVSAYPGKDFPVVDPDSRCVLCQQVLEEDSRNRLKRFEEFVKNDIQEKSRRARSGWDERIQNLTNLRTMSDMIKSNLSDLEVDHLALSRQAESHIQNYESARIALIDAISKRAAINVQTMDNSFLIGALESERKKAEELSAELANVENVKAKLQSIIKDRKELELLQSATNLKRTILDEIARRKERDRLEWVKNEAATGSITRQIVELSESNVTTVIRHEFTREATALKLDRVTLSKTRGDKGALLHQPRLVGARQDAVLGRVFSEGEQRALGLAAFFTESELEPSKSALILDDPVSSLDHVRRGLVADRLTTFAQSRQVIIFTHDQAFVAELKLSAHSKGVEVTDRSVEKSRGIDEKPGACIDKHPWDVKDVAERIQELTTKLASIKKESASWDQTRYGNEVALWAGGLSETWERMFRQEIVGQILKEGGLEVRPMMVRILSKFSEQDEVEFQTSYSRVSQWARRHDKSPDVHYSPPDVSELEAELKLVAGWFNRVKKYKS